MHCTEVDIEIGNKQIECRVSYDYDGGEEAIIHLAPEDCSPGSHAEYEIHHLEIDRDGHGWVSFDELIEDYWERIEEALEKYRISPE